MSLQIIIGGKLVAKWNEVHHPRKMYKLFNLLAGNK